MSRETGIAWTDATWNPWTGCSVVSPGCAHCYMFRDQRRYGRDPEKVVRSKTTFTAPLKWKEPRRVFTCSWSDFFHEAADAWRDEAWEVIRQTPQHTYQILTKRPERIEGRIPWGSYGDPWPHVWLGVSVENVKFEWRANVLCTIPAALRFVSAEPLLGDLEFSNSTLNCLGWMIVGGESGPDFRPMNLTWLSRLAFQCEEFHIPLFVKQDAGPLPGKRGSIPDALWVQQFPERGVTRYPVVR